MENIDSICRLCGRFNNTENLISVLDNDEDELSTKPNLLQKIRFCLPVEVCMKVDLLHKFHLISINRIISLYFSFHIRNRSVHSTPFQKKVCKPCCARTVSVYEFIRTVLTTQESLNSRLDTPSQILTNKAKVANLLRKRLQIENLPKRIPVVEKAEVIEKLHKCGTRVKISKLIESPTEQKALRSICQTSSNE